MKRFFLLPLSVLVAVAISFSGCTEEDDDTDTVTGSMSAKIDGELWTATSVEAMHSSDIAEALWTISGHTSDATDNRQMEFNIYNDDYHQSGEHTYPIGPDQCCDVMRASFIINQSAGGYQGYDSRSEETNDIGELVITSDDETTVSGTFHFVGHNIITDETINVTEGQFTIKYTN